MEDRGAVGGYAASAYRAHPGLTIHRGLLAPDEITTVGRVMTTTPRRTAYDLACGLPLV